MLPFGTICLPVSLWNPPGAVRTEFKPERAVMRSMAADFVWGFAWYEGALVPLHCPSVVATVGATRGDWGPVAHPALLALHCTWLPQTSSASFIPCHSVRDAAFDAVQNNSTKIPNTPTEFYEHFCAKHFTAFWLPPRICWIQTSCCPLIARGISNGCSHALHPLAYRAFPSVHFRMAERTQLHAMNYCH